MALFKKDPEEILDLSVAAQMLKVSVEGLLGALERDCLPARKIDGRWRLSREALVGWLRDGSSRDYTAGIFCRLTAFNLTRSNAAPVWLA